MQEINIFKKVNSFNNFDHKNKLSYSYKIIKNRFILIHEKKVFSLLSKIHDIKDRRSNIDNINYYDADMISSKYQLFLHHYLQETTTNQFILALSFSNTLKLVNPMTQPGLDLKAISIQWYIASIILKNKLIENKKLIIEIEIALLLDKLNRSTNKHTNKDYNKKSSQRYHFFKNNDEIDTRLLLFKSI